MSLFLGRQNGRADISSVLLKLKKGTIFGFGWLGCIETELIFVSSEVEVQTNGFVVLFAAQSILRMTNLCFALEASSKGNFFPLPSLLLWFFFLLVCEPHTQ